MDVGLTLRGVLDEEAIKKLSEPCQDPDVFLIPLKLKRYEEANILSLWLKFIAMPLDASCGEPIVQGVDPNDGAHHSKGTNGGPKL